MFGNRYFEIRIAKDPKQKETPVTEPRPDFPETYAKFRMVGKDVMTAVALLAAGRVALHVIEEVATDRLITK